MEIWQNFYLQKMGTSSEATYESVSQWGIWCKDIPFKMIEKVKEPASYSWKDEDGDDEYIPSTGLRAEAYTMDVEFGCKLMAGVSGERAAVTDVRAKVKAFVDYLRTSGMLMMYSEHTRIGRQEVRLVSVSDNAKWVSRKEWQAVNNVRTLVTVKEFLVFKVTFKVNDPVTDIVKNGSGKLDVVSTVTT